MIEKWKELDEFRGRIFTGEWPTVPELFQIAVEKWPENNSFSVFDPEKKTMSYREAWEKILKIASYLKEKGISKGDKVALNGKNSPEWALSYFGILSSGATVVPFDNQMKTEKMMALSAFAGIKFVIADFDVLERLKNQRNEWYDSLSGVLMMKGKSDEYTSIHDVKPENVLELPVKCDENDLAAILFTSGTTGNEKGAMLSHKNLTSNVYQAVSFITYLNDKDVFYALLPLHHSYCCTTVLLETVKHGAECIFGHGIVVSRMINDLKRGHVTVFMGIPLLYNKVIAGVMDKIKKQGKLVYALITTLMAFNGFCKKHFGKAPLRGFFNKKILSQLGLDHSRILICGAGPLSPKVFKQYQQLGLDFLQGYGLTETSPILTLNPREHFKIDSVGKVLPLIDMIIADKDSEGNGEIRVKGPNICLGYYNDEEHTKELFDENGYLRTGDLGYLDSENYCYLRGRAKNIIVTEGGKNVFPEEIEDMFQTYPQIEQIMIRGFQEKKDVPCEAIEAVIFPSPDFYKGKSQEDAEKEITALVHEVNKSLVGYKKIEKITFVKEAMEMTTTKKIKRATVAR